MTFKLRVNKFIQTPVIQVKRSVNRIFERIAAEAEAILVHYIDI